MKVIYNPNFLITAHCSIVDIGTFITAHWRLVILHSDIAVNCIFLMSLWSSSVSCDCFSLLIVW
jgi:hypothetical protein